MNTKYELVEGDEKEVAPGVVVKRIRALVAIPATIFSPAVAPGGNSVDTYRKKAILMCMVTRGCMVTRECTTTVSFSGRQWSALKTELSLSTTQKVTICLSLVDASLAHPLNFLPSRQKSMTNGLTANTRF